MRMRSIGLYRGYNSGLQHSMRLHSQFISQQLARSFPTDRLIEQYDKPYLFTGNSVKETRSLYYKLDRYITPRIRFGGSALDLLVISDHSDAYISLINPSQKTLIVCHDVLPRLLDLGQIEGIRPSVFGRQLMRLNGLAMRRADAVVCVSESTRRDLLNNFAVNPDRVTVIPNFPLIADPGPEPFTEDVNTFTQALANPTPFVLSVGGGKFYKNLRAVPPVLRAMQLAGIEVRWIIVGDADFNPDRENLSGSVIFLQGLSSRQMRELFSRAAALYFPSLYEGFGLPVVEAQFYSLPVVSSVRGALKEVLGYGGVAVDPYDYPGAAAALGRILVDTTYRNSLVERGRQNLKQFSQGHCEAAYDAVFRATLRQDQLEG